METFKKIWKFLIDGAEPLPEGMSFVRLESNIL